MSYLNFPTEKPEGVRQVPFFSDTQLIYDPKRPVSAVPPEGHIGSLLSEHESRLLGNRYSGDQQQRFSGDQLQAQPQLPPQPPQRFPGRLHLFAINIFSFVADSELNNLVFPIVCVINFLYLFEIHFIFSLF